MKVARFNTGARLILVRGLLEGPLGRARPRLALDTGSEHTLIVPEILDELGYGEEKRSRASSLRLAANQGTSFVLRSSVVSAIKPGTFASTRTTYRKGSASTASSA